LGEDVVASDSAVGKEEEQSISAAGSALSEATEVARSGRASSQSGATSSQPPSRGESAHPLSRRGSVQLQQREVAAEFGGSPQGSRTSFEPPSRGTKPNDDEDVSITKHRQEADTQEECGESATVLQIEIPEGEEEIPRSPHEAEYQRSLVFLEARWDRDLAEEQWLRQARVLQTTRQSASHRWRGRDGSTQGPTSATTHRSRNFERDDGALSRSRAKLLSQVYGLKTATPISLRPQTCRVREGTGLGVSSATPPLGRFPLDSRRRKERG